MATVPLTPTTSGDTQISDYQVDAELRQLDRLIGSIRDQPGVEVFPLNDRILAKAVEVAGLDLALKPFDQSVLAAVLGRAAELREAGETDLCFCEADADLHPWGKDGRAKPWLTELYNEAQVRVYGDFSLTSPERPKQWP